MRKRELSIQKENLISPERVHKKRKFLQGHFGELNIILEQLSDRTVFWSRLFLKKKF